MQDFLEWWRLFPTPLNYLQVTRSTRSLWVATRTRRFKQGRHRITTAQPCGHNLEPVLLASIDLTGRTWPSAKQWVPSVRHLRTRTTNSPRQKRVPQAIGLRIMIIWPRESRRISRRFHRKNRRACLRRQGQLNQALSMRHRYLNSTLAQ